MARCADYPPLHQMLFVDARGSGSPLPPVDPDGNVDPGHSRGPDELEEDVWEGTHVAWVGYEVEL